jgi:hypothetical protein
MGLEAIKMELTVYDACPVSQKANVKILRKFLLVQCTCTAISMYESIA